MKNGGCFHCKRARMLVIGYLNHWKSPYGRARGREPPIDKRKRDEQATGREFPYYKMKNESRPRRMDRLMC